jgi:glucose/arabinose dehydrogenase
MPIFESRREDVSAVVKPPRAEGHRRHGLREDQRRRAGEAVLAETRGRRPAGVHLGPDGHLLVARCRAEES